MRRTADGYHLKQRYTESNNYINLVGKNLYVKAIGFTCFKKVEWMMCVCEHAHLCAYACVRLYRYEHVCVCVWGGGGAYVHGHARVHMFRHATRTCTHKHPHTYTQTYKWTYICKKYLGTNIFFPYHQFHQLLPNQVLFLQHLCLYHVY